MPTQTEPDTAIGPAGALLERWQTAHLDTARRMVPEAFDPTGRPVRELTADEDTACILAANAEVSPHDLQPVTTCQYEHEVWGPHEGCREFMAHPETFLCGAPTTTVIEIRDHWYEATCGDDGRVHHWLCDQHAAETRASIQDWETVLSDTRIAAVTAP